MSRKALLYIFLPLILSACGGSSRVAKNSRAPQIEHEVLGNRGKTRPKSTREAAKSKKEMPVTARVERARKKGALEDFVREWEGTPHRMGGTTKKGVDCSGFVIRAAEDVFETQFRGRRAEDLFAEVQTLEREELQYGDLVFFKIDGRRISHVGIYLGEGQFAHTSSSQGVMVSSLEQKYFRKRFFKGGRLPEN